MPFNGSGLSSNFFAPPLCIYSPHFVPVASLACAGSFWCPACVVGIEGVPVFAMGCRICASCPAKLSIQDDL